MRVVCGLLLLAFCGGLVSVSVSGQDSANTFHITAAAGSDSYTIDGSADPILNMTIGTTYYISIEFANTNHPFGLNTDISSLTVADHGLVNNGSCAGSATDGYVSAGTAPFCVLAFTPTANTPQPLYYHCTVHTAMVGQITVSSATTAAPTTAAPTTEAPTTAAPTTEAPTTAAPTTEAPTTAAPTTGTPTTETPTTQTPTTEAPTTQTPTTETPTTQTPTTETPTTQTPTTETPTTQTPTTLAPTTLPPTTAAPTTAGNATASPTTAGNATASPTTAGNATASPTTAGNATASPTTAAPTSAPTNAPTTPAPVTPVAGATLVGSSFRITGNTGTSAYLFTASGTVYSNPTLNVTAGSTITIALEYSTHHPLGLSNNSNPSAFSLAYDFPNVYQGYTFNATYCNTTFSATVKTIRMATTGIVTPQPCVITVNVPTNVPVLYYRCALHPAMIGRINVVPATPTNAPTNTPTPTPKPTSSATPQSVFGTGVALLVAVFAMLMA